jgi:hypothetical protein
MDLSGNLLRRVDLAFVVSVGSDATAGRHFDDNTIEALCS